MYVCMYVCMATNKIEVYVCKLLSETRDQRFYDHLRSFEQNMEPNDESGRVTTPIILPGMLNYNLPWRKTDEFPDPSLEDFVPDTSPDKFRFDK